MEMGISLSTESNFNYLYNQGMQSISDPVAKSTQNKVILVVVFNSQDTSVLPQLVI